MADSVQTTQGYTLPAWMTNAGQTGFQNLQGSTQGLVGQIPGKQEQMQTGFNQFGGQGAGQQTD